MEQLFYAQIFYAQNFYAQIFYAQKTKSTWSSSRNENFKFKQNQNSTRPKELPKKHTMPAAPKFNRIGTCIGKEKAIANALKDGNWVLVRWKRHLVFEREWNGTKQTISMSKSPSTPYARKLILKDLEEADMA